MSRVRAAPFVLVGSEFVPPLLTFASRPLQSLPNWSRGNIAVLTNWLTRFFFGGHLAPRERHACRLQISAYIPQPLGSIWELLSHVLGVLVGKGLT